MVGAQSSRDIGPGKEEEDTRANCDSDLRVAKTELERKEGEWRTAGVSRHSESKKTEEEEEDKDQDQDRRCRGQGARASSAQARGEAQVGRRGARCREGIPNAPRGDGAGKGECKNAAGGG